jgi:hypothetical protein
MILSPFYSTLHRIAIRKHVPFWSNYVLDQLLVDFESSQYSMDTIQERRLCTIPFAQ